MLTCGLPSFQRIVVLVKRLRDLAYAGAYLCALMACLRSK